MLDFLSVVLSLAVPVFEKLEIAYYVGGSVASGMHGDRRQTNDVDIVADLQVEQVPKFVALLQAEFYVDEPTILKAVRERGSFNIIHFITSYKIDVFPVKNRPYDQQVIARRKQGIVDCEPPVEVYAAQPEDIVLAKLEWFRQTGETSDRQWNDILGVLKLQCFDLDINYITTWAREIKVDDLLNRALEDAGYEDSVGK